MENKPVLKSVNKWKYFSWLVVIVLLFVLGWIGYLYVSSHIQKLSSRWQELQFAYDHPAIVKTTREEYASKSAQLEASFTAKKTDEPTPEQQILQQLADQVKTPTSK